MFFLFVCFSSLPRCMLPHLVMSIPGTVEDILVQNPVLSTQALSTCKVIIHINNMNHLILLYFFLRKCLLIDFSFFFSNVLLFSSEDPWSSSGYSAMLGNSPHIGQPGSFPAINPQDRMVRESHLYYLLSFSELIIMNYYFFFIFMMMWLISRGSSIIKNHHHFFISL